MKVPKFGTALAVAAAFVGSSLATPLQAANIEGPKVFWKISMWGNPRALSVGMEELAKRAAAETDGNFQIKIFYGAQLSSNRENLDGIKLNAFEGAAICNFYHPGKNPAWMVFFLIALFRGTRVKTIKDALMESAKLTVMIFSLIWGVLIFVRFLGFSGLPEAFTTWILSLDASPMVIMICILIAYSILGMFMDAIGDPALRRGVWQSVGCPWHGHLQPPYPGPFVETPCLPERSCGCIRRAVRACTGWGANRRR